jgi:CDP-diacylglycerol--glycerol-3-phosphate 3-phosphatidyltransferase
VFKSLKKINLPTKITLARIALLPLILFFYAMAVCANDIPFFRDWGKLIAALLFVVAVATDWLDGYIARRMNLVTNTGKLLDPVADKMLNMLGFILVIADPVWFHGHSFALPYWFAVLAVFVALGRDIIMNSLRFIAAEQGIVIAADRLGKLKSLFQFIAITLYMLFAFNLNVFVQFVPDGVWLDTWAWICVFILGVATILTVWSCGNYVSSYIKNVSKKSKEEENENGKK